MSEPILNLYFLVGPTASGKSEVALILARTLGAEIVSMDSMAIYKGMDVGTAKPTKEERAQVTHHLIDIVQPWAPYTVARYLRDAETAIRDILGRGRQVLFVGGTGLYLKRFREGLFRGPGASADVRERLQRRAKSEGPHALHAELAGLDPATAERLHPNDTRRVIRAIEVCLTAGRPMSELHAEYRKKLEDEREEHLGAEKIAYKMVALRRERNELDARIKARTQAMFRQGVIEETRRVAERCAERIPRPVDLPESWRYYMGGQTSRALGYFDVLRHLNGEVTLQECREMVYTHTRQFSTKQMTWFRSFSDMHWLDLKADTPARQAADKAASILRA
jgi:tRNA dimethylallyltransferase